MKVEAAVKAKIALGVLREQAPMVDLVAASGGRAKAGLAVASAIGRDQAPGRVLIAGSLYLAGVVLRQDGEE